MMDADSVMQRPGEAWAVMPDLAERTGRAPSLLERPTRMQPLRAIICVLPTTVGGAVGGSRQASSTSARFARKRATAKG